MRKDMIDLASRKPEMDADRERERSDEDHAEDLRRHDSL